MKKQWNAWWIHGAAVCCVLFLGLALEFAFNRRELSLPDSERQLRQISAADIEYEGFEEKDGTLLFLQDTGEIRISLDGGYVGRFGYSFDYDGLLNVELTAVVHNVYGEARERDQLHIKDRNSKLVSQSWVRIGKETDEIRIKVRQSQLEEAGLSYIDFRDFPLSFTGFYINNEPFFHWQRLLFTWCVLGIAAFLVLNRELLGRRVEIGFLVVSLSVGILMAAALPVNKVSWDEEIHFENAFWLSSYPKAADISDSIMQMFSAGIDTWPYNQPSGQEEQQMLNRYWDENGNYKDGVHHWRAKTDKTTFQGYAGSMVMLRLGRLLGLRFSLLYRLGRLGNLLVYCGLMYLAIKKTPVGKGIMAFIGLMPTPMLLASVYSYDPMVTACLYLSFAWTMSAALSEEKQMDWKTWAVIAGAFVIGCRTKAVYAPLGLLPLMIPRERYRNRRQQYLMQGGLVLITVLLLCSFLLPTLISPSETGDLRGGATSEVGQMAYVLGQPLAYAAVLIQNIWQSLPGYVLGEGVFGVVGILGATAHPWMFYAASVLVILTNSQITSRRALNGRQKIWMLTLAGAAAVLVWTSMYMAFTVPGETSISGVQGRYYLPLLFVLYLIPNSRKVVVHIPNRIYYPALLGVSGIILTLTVYEHILAPYCF